MSRTTFVHSFGENGLFEQIGSPKAKVALTPALLIGRDATTGEWVKATNVAGSVIRAISVVKEGAIARPGDAYVSNPDRDMAIGAPQTADKFFLLEVPKDTYTFAQVSARTPIYLGVDGAFVTTVPTGVGTLVQKVGEVHERNFIKINLELDPQGTVLKV